MLSQSLGAEVGFFKQWTRAPARHSASNMSVLSALRDIFFWWWPRRQPVPFPVLFKKFKSILERNNKILERIGDMNDKLGGEYVFDRQYILDSCEQLGDQVFKLVSDLSVFTQRKNVALFMAFERVQHLISEELSGRRALGRTDHILPLAELTHDLADEGGAKMANLGDIGNILGLRVPEGFVITTGAYFHLLDYNHMRELVETQTARLAGADDATVAEISSILQNAVLNMRLPKELRAAMDKAVDRMAGKRLAGVLLAVRSSAWDEDGETSFAGLHQSVLGVRREDLPAAYLQVLASLFSEEALRWRIYRGWHLETTAMAVGVQRLVSAEVSGGLYTYVPGGGHGSGSAMVVSSSWGLGDAVVDGTMDSDTFVLQRDPPYRVVSSDVVAKPLRMVRGERDGTHMDGVPRELQGVPSLSPERMEALAHMAMGLERFFRRPLDVEWAFGPDGELTILQARPLSIRSRQPEECELLSQAAAQAEVLFSGQGVTAMGGVASGKAYMVRQEDEDLSDFPYGAILVVHHSSPKYAKIMPKVRGIIADVGSATGHMATIARELRVPTLVGTGVATKTLAHGQEITLDATHNTVYRGAVPALCRMELAQEDIFEESREYRLLKRVLKHISPLTLVDPNAESFRPEDCITHHDITRYVHQKAVEGLIELSESLAGRREATPRKLASQLPLGLMVIDVDRGLNPDAPANDVPESDVRSVPFRMLLEGLNKSDMWETTPVGVDMGSFMASATRTFGPAQASSKSLGRNLAVISREYLNLHLRLGYHFTVVDAYIGPSVNDNSIYFRFMGGVTEYVRRSRRAVLVADILERHDFRVEVRGEMVEGRAKKHSTRSMLDKMRMLGGLVGFTRQLDARLDSDEAVRRYVEEFQQRIKTLGGQSS